MNIRGQYEDKVFSLCNTRDIPQKGDIIFLGQEEFKVIRMTWHFTENENYKVYTCDDVTLLLERP